MIDLENVLTKAVRVARQFGVKRLLLFGTGCAAGFGAARSPDPLHPAHRKTGARAFVTAEELKAEIEIEFDALILTRK